MENVINRAEQRLNAAINAGEINSINKLKRFPNLDSSLIRFIIGPINENTKVVDYSPIDESVCKKHKCGVWNSIQSIYNLSDGLKDRDPESLLSEDSMVKECREKCKECPYNNIQSHTTYINPKKKYNLYNMSRSIIDRDKIKLSKLLIKIMIVLQCWPAELISECGEQGNDGIIPNVYVPDLANILDCNVNYLEDGLCNLGNIGLISLEKLGPHLYNIIMPGYHLKYKKANQGGGGYIQIDRDILKSLLDENSITALRGKLIQLLSNPFAYNTDRTISISINEFKNIMPKYVCYKAEYKKALDNDLFSMTYNKRTNEFIYTPNDTYQSVNENKTEIMKKNVKFIGKALEVIKPTFLNKTNTTINEHNRSYRNNVNLVIENNMGDIPDEVVSNNTWLSFLKDCIVVGVEYGFSNVIDTIRKIERNYRVNGNKIKNAGALLRTSCCYNMLYSTA